MIAPLTFQAHSSQSVTAKFQIANFTKFASREVNMNLWSQSMSFDIPLKKKYNKYGFRNLPLGKIDLSCLRLEIYKTYLVIQNGFNFYKVEKFILGKSKRSLISNNFK